MDDDTTTRQLLGDTERWFVRRGLPHAIEDYSASRDVFTRAAPFLTFVFFVEVFFSFDDRFGGWAQFGAFAGGLALLVGGLIVVNRLRGRAPLQLPDDIGIPELTLFVFGPASLPIFFSDDRVIRSLLVVGINLVIVGLAFLVTSYGLVPALRVGASQVVRQFRTVLHLVARGLPLLLLFSVFVFLNAEMWQVAHDFEPLYYAVAVGVLLVLALAFLVLRVPSEINALGRFSTWSEVSDCAARTDAPLANHRPTGSGAPPAPGLNRVDRVNIGLLLVISQVVQVLLVGAAVGLFYVGFGLLAVGEDTILQWTTADRLDPVARFDFLGGTMVLTWELLAVAGFIAAFSVLQFAVSSVTDATFRDEFGNEVTQDVRDVLAVRMLYLDLV